MLCVAPMQVDELSAKYEAVSIEEVEEGWKNVYERSLTSCMHGAACQQGPACQVCLTEPSLSFCTSAHLTQLAEIDHNW